MAIRYLSGINVDSNTLFVDSTNNRVGIGTASPISLLNLNNGDAWVNVTDTLRGLQFGFAGPSHGSYRAAVMGGAESYGGTDSGMLTFHTQNGYAVSAIPPERMRITSSGNVGIGTTSPSDKLAVSGGITGDTLTLNSGAGINVTSYGFLSQTVSGQMTFLGHNVRASTSTANTALVVNSGWYSSLIKMYYSDGITFHTSATSYTAGDVFPLSTTERMRIRSNGSILFNAYGAGSITGTAAYGLAVDSSGNVIEVTSTIDGSGTANYVTKWQDSNTLTNSIIYDNGTNVGIGNTSPTAKLQVGPEAHPSATGIEVAAGAGGANLLALTDTTNHNWFPYTDGKNYYSAIEHTFRNELHSTDWMKITSAGNVGIGTNTPTLINSGRGNVTINGSSDSIAVLSIADAWKSYWYVTSGASYLASEGNRPLYLETNSGVRVAIMGNGNVGIGTTNPAYALDVYRGSGDGARVRVMGSANFALLQSQNDSGALYVGIDSSTASGFGLGNYSRIIWSSGAYPLAIAVGDAERMRITAGGDVGIGTASPSQKLHVVGSVRVTGAYYDSNNEAGTSGQVLTSTVTGTDWVTPATTTATSLYDLLPAARVAYNWTGQVVNDTWVDVFSAANNVLTTGTWMIEMYVSDWASGGAHYTYTYTGVMRWYQETVNQGGESAASEIYLHRMGHAANSSVLYLRTTEMTAVSGGIGKLQVKANYSNTSNTTINFKFVKIF